MADPYYPPENPRTIPELKAALAYHQRISQGRLRVLTQKEAELRGEWRRAECAEASADMLAEFIAGLKAIVGNHQMADADLVAAVTDLKAKVREARQPKSGCPADV
jgi:hypothetical protein